MLHMAHPDGLGTGNGPIFIQREAQLDLGQSMTFSRAVTGAGLISTYTNVLTMAADGSLTPLSNTVATLTVTATPPSPPGTLLLLR